MKTTGKSQQKTAQQAEKQGNNTLVVVVLVFLAHFAFVGCSSDKESSKKEKVQVSEADMVRKETKDIKKEFDDDVVKNYAAGLKVVRLISVDPEEWPVAVSKTPAAQWVKYLIEVWKDPNRVKEGVPLMMLLNPPSEKALKTWIDTLMNLPDKHFPPLAKSLEALGYTPPEKWSSAHEHTLLAFIQRGLNFRKGKLELYEIDQIDPEQLPPTEFRTVAWFYKGLIYLEHGYNYLASREFDKGIDWAGNEDVEWSGLLDNGIYFKKVEDKQEEGVIDLMMTGMLLKSYARISLPGQRDKALIDLQKYLDHSRTKANFTALNVLAYMAFEFEKGAIQKGREAFYGWTPELPMNEMQLDPLSGLVGESKSVNDLVRYGVFSYVFYQVLSDWLSRELGVDGNPWVAAYEEVVDWYNAEFRSMVPPETAEKDAQ